MQDEPQDPIEQVLGYHERTKHHPNAYARSLGYLDWATQPDPFRRFAGAPRLPLEHPAVSAEPYFDELFATRPSQPRPVNRATISQLFYDSLALSAWKEVKGAGRWSLRVNPSSGDLHPTEGYLIAGAINGLSTTAGVYHYSPFEHALERRLELAHDQWQALAQQLPSDCVLVGLSSIYWREAWKYGERAFRYCQHDIGHAIGAVVLASAALGWRVRLLDTIANRELALLLGIHRQSGPEAEHPDCLLAVFPVGEGSEPAAVELKLRPDGLAPLADAEWVGTENRLSRDHQPWPIIDAVAAATRYDGRSGLPYPSVVAVIEGSGTGLLPERALPARRIIRQRRSAVAMDGRTEIDREVFYHMLARVTPRLSPVFQSLPWRPRVSLALFVHRVSGLEPGLYLLARDPSHRDVLRTTLRQEFLWQKPSTCPDLLDLYLLFTGDARDTARIISCHQDIAAEGAFALGMLAEFEPSLNQQGAWFYPRLFWETGLIGQILYLEAEAAGLRATGIGCFFDDVMHQILGIEDHSWQSLYHFTVGRPIDDPRLKTLTAYFHLESPR